MKYCPKRHMMSFYTVIPGDTNGNHILIMNHRNRTHRFSTSDYWSQYYHEHDWLLSVGWLPYEGPVRKEWFRETLS